jgi:hypothetical protein
MAKKNSSKKNNKHNKSAIKDFISSKSNIIKVTSIVIVAIFIVIILIGIFRDTHEQSRYTVPTPDQLALANALVASDLQNIGDNIANYNFTVSKKMTFFERENRNENNSARVLQVCLSNNITKHVYSLDLSTKQILMHTETSIYTTNTKFIKYSREENDCRSRD